MDLDLKHDLLAAEFQEDLGGRWRRAPRQAQCVALALQEKCEVLIDDWDGNDLAYGNGLTAWSTTKVLEYRIREGGASIPGRQRSTWTLASPTAEILTSRPDP